MPNPFQELSKSDLGVRLMAVGVLLMVLRFVVRDEMPRGDLDDPFWLGVRLGLVAVPIVAVVAGVVLMILGARERRSQA